MSSDSLSAEVGAGLVCAVDATPLADVTFPTANEEHGFLAGPGIDRLAVGDLVRVIPNHACGTTNMWSAVSGATTSPPFGPRASMQLKTVPGSRVVSVVETVDGKLWSKTYASAGWTNSDNGTPLATNLASTSAVPFGITR